MRAAPETFALRAADGVPITAYRFGGSGPVGLLAHATGFPLLVYAPLLERLAGSLSVLGPDLRGAGRSGWPASGDASWLGFVADLQVTLGDARGVIGIGHSSGATALLLLEAAASGTFAAMYLYEPAYFPSAESGPGGAALVAERASGARRRRPTFASPADARERLARSPIGSLDPAAFDAYLANAFASRPDGSLRLTLRPDWEAAIYEAAPAAADALDAAAVGCPVHLVVGTASRPEQRSGADRLCARLARASLEVMDGLGHLGPLEAPAAVADSLRAWLSSVEAPRF